jgi:hypothetical protein
VRLFRLGHREDLFPGDLHVVDLARVLLDIDHQFVVGFSSNHLPAVTLMIFATGVTSFLERILRRVCCEGVGSML